MPQWEYAQVLHVVSEAGRDVTVRFTHRAQRTETEGLWAVLGRLGDEGWELVGPPRRETFAFGPTPATSGTFSFCFKRPRAAAEPA